jgi:hypothetical protein
MIQCLCGRAAPPASVEYQTAEDNRRRCERCLRADCHQRFDGAQETLSARYPDLTFVERLGLRGSDRSMALISRH